MEEEGKPGALVRVDADVVANADARARADAKARADASANANANADPEPSFLQRAKAAPITFGLAAINGIVFALAERSGSTRTNVTLLEFGAVEPQLVWSGEYWRLATAMFLHIGIIHLVWNTYASIGWSTTMERALGKWRFILVYLLSGIGASCASVLSSHLSFVGPHISAGASGAMFGIIGATLALRRRQLGTFRAFVADGAIRSTMIQIGIWTVIGLTALHMDNAAHFGGLVVGFALTWVMSSKKPRLAAVAFAIGFAALVVLATQWKASWSVLG